MAKVVKVQLPSFFYLLPAIFTANVSVELNEGILWPIVNFFFWPLAWIKWIIYREVSIEIIRKSLEWFLGT